LLDTPKPTTLRRRTRTRQHNFYFASNQIFKDLRNEPAILAENEFPAGLESRSDKAPCKTHKDDLIQKVWETERTTSVEVS